MAAVTIHSDFGAPPKIKPLSVSIVSPSICHEVMGPDAMIFVFLMLSFRPTFSLSSFTFIRRLFSSFLLSAIRVVSSVYLRLIFLPAILIPAYASSSPAFHMMYSAYKFGEFYQTCKEGLTPVKVKLNSFTIIKRFFSSSLLSAIRVVTSAYLRL